MTSDAYAFLRKVPMFADLPASDLEQICQNVEEVLLPAGEVLFSEGSVAHHAYVIKEGQVEIYKGSKGQAVQLAVRQSGEVIGEMSLLEAGPRNASGRALTDSLLLVISHEQLDQLLRTSPSAARTMLYTITNRLRSTELLLNQSEKMAQLGTLTAGIAHELNNPASAVQRGAEQLKSAFNQYEEVSAGLNRLQLSLAQVQALHVLGERIRSMATQPADLSPMERSDREYALEDWMDQRGVPNSWELAPQLADLTLSPADLDRVAEGYPAGSLAALLRWMAVSFSIDRLFDEISQGAGRIAEIIKALKSYVYLDQGPVQEIDIHDGLENTLVILRHKLKEGVEVRREFGSGIPRIQAYGSELNQVWTNMIDNAVYAMKGKGRVTLRTRFKDPWVVVEIEDDGPGIPQEVQGKLFSPFFTTKPIGQGTGLGLNISYNIIHKHGGDVKVTSQPGLTRFEVWLPVDFHQVRTAGKTLQPIHRQADSSLRHIYENTRTIAVVGMSDRPDRPAFSVPAYLQKHGFRVIPVNPRISEALGEKAYPDLESVPDPIDLVLVFRASEHVPQIVDSAIAVGAKYIWMQEGIVNEAAAQKASQAGLEVVMDTCMRNTHRRLFGGTDENALSSGESEPSQGEKA